MASLYTHKKLLCVYKLEKAALEPAIAFIGYLDLTRVPLDTTVHNTNLRSADYRQLNWWSHGSMEESVRLAVPACAVKKIQ